MAMLNNQMVYDVEKPWENHQENCLQMAGFPHGTVSLPKGRCNKNELLHPDLVKHEYEVICSLQSERRCACQSMGNPWRNKRTAEKITHQAQ